MSDPDISAILSLALTKNSENSAELKIVKELLAVVLALQSSEYEDSEGFALRVMESMRAALHNSLPMDDLGQEHWSIMEQAIDDVLTKTLGHIEMVKIARSETLLNERLRDMPPGD